MRAPAHYDERHAYAIHTGTKTVWLGDPARGEFLPREKRKAKRGKSSRVSR